MSPTLHIDRPPDGKRVISGTLGYDSIEGGCRYIEASDGTRYELVLPAGWEFQGSELRSPDGVEARIGDSVTARGMLAVDMASTCQIGPIFRLSEITSDR